MLNLAAVLFALAAVGGAALAWMHFKGKEIPLPIAIVHGLFAASGLVTLILVVMGGEASGPYLNFSLVLFVVAALGGFVLFAMQLKGKGLSTPVVLIHGVVAVVAFVLLLSTILGRTA